MNFLFDIHISYKIVKKIQTPGHESVHVNKILDKRNTKD